MIKIEFTKQEAQVLVQLIHVAVQAKGLEAAEAGVVLSRKLTEALKAEDNGKTDN